MLTVALALCAFSPPPRNSLMARHEFISHALVGAVGVSMAPAAIAVAPPSPQQMLKSRAVYGSRVYRLQDATPAVIIDEKNVFTLFITGVYGSTADKLTKKELERLEKAALTAANKGDAVAAQTAIKQFIALGQIKELDNIPGSYYNAKSPCDRAGLQCGYLYKGYLGSTDDDVAALRGR
uniref:Photosystem II Psb31 protein domain-containing protein n=1 Tax=Haptolina brevifila TaxID=156173 RepID=A0A7S2CE98_9EUKA|mmetsp:Transcript_23600/g.47128  ORF Transcript_23600/g.47128 Transcript_23600/m.47128 type:complete len:180 (+) Transcript_23600:149-688(+)